MSKARKNALASFKAKIALATLREDTDDIGAGLKDGVHATVIHRWKLEVLAAMDSLAFWQAGRT